MKLSIIIPTLNEAKVLPELLSTLVLGKQKQDEIIVVDGGSSDRTAVIARRFSARVYSSKTPGRGIQMNYGASKAKGNVLWFLHADSALSLEWREQLEAVMEEGPIVGGGFKVRIDADGIGYRFLDAWGAFRARAQRSFYGDQGIFVRKETFEALKGFPEWPILEDLDFSTRMKKQGKVVLLPGPMRTSARTWQQQGWFKTAFRHSKLATAHALGFVKPDKGIALVNPRKAGVSAVVMAKAPIPGTVKTRLCPPLNKQQAAEVATDLLKSTVSMVSGIQGLDTSMAIAPRNGIAQVKQLIPKSVNCFPQVSGHLGQRLFKAFERAFSDGAKYVVVLGTDHPDLPESHVTTAIRHLTQEGADVVLGPTEDGGYYLVGLCKPCPELFRKIPWSTSRVLDVTLRRAKREGLQVKLLPKWFDLDRPKDLQRVPRFRKYLPNGRA